MNVQGVLSAVMYVCFVLLMFVSMHLYKRVRDEECEPCKLDNLALANTYAMLTLAFLVMAS